MNSYYNGVRDGIRKYAWWKDGVQYVGCGVYTLQDALTEVNEIERKTISSNILKLETSLKERS